MLYFRRAKPFVQYADFYLIPVAPAVALLPGGRNRVIKGDVCGVERNIVLYRREPSDEYVSRLAVKPG